MVAVFDKFALLPSKQWHDIQNFQLDECATCD